MIISMFKKIRKKIKSSFLYQLTINFFGEYNRSFSESFGEDLFVNYFFQQKKKGFYVDIGCNLPKSRSTTYLLYKKGWDGIKVDISPRSTYDPVLEKPILKNKTRTGSNIALKAVPKRQLITME